MAGRGGDGHAPGDEHAGAAGAGDGNVFDPAITRYVLMPERHTTVLISNFVVKSPTITGQTRPLGRLPHIVKFATYGILLSTT